MDCEEREHTHVFERAKHLRMSNQVLVLLANGESFVQRNPHMPYVTIMKLRPRRAARFGESFEQVVRLNEDVDYVRIDVMELWKEDNRYKWSADPYYRRDIVQIYVEKGSLIAGIDMPEEWAAE